MAVEIPVVVDIDQAFKDAAKRVGVAMEPLQRSVEKMTKDLSFWNQTLREANIKGNEWLVAAKNIQSISEALAVAEYEMKRYTSNDASIKQMSLDIAELERRWREMGAAQKYTTDESGRRVLSNDSKNIINQYREITSQIEKQGKSLSQIVSEEKKLADAVRGVTQQRRYENAILKMNGDSMRILQEQERILSQRLLKAKIGSDKYNELATRLRAVRVEMDRAKASADGMTASNNKMSSSASRAKSSIDAANSSLKRQSNLLMQLKSIAAMYFSVFGGLRLLRNIRETTAELELQKVALGSILNDTDRAKELFREIKAAALKSPFEIKDLLTYTKQLSAYRVEEEKLFDVTMRLADVSAGLGVDMNRLILAYGQVRAASVLRGQELRQFTEAGIPLVELLAEKFRKLGREGTTTADVFELISKRAVPFKMIEEIFEDMTSAGEVFYKMQEKQSETLKGKWMKLKDAVTIMYDEIGNTKTMRSAMEGLIDSALKLARSWREVSAWIDNGIRTIIAYTVVSKAAAVATSALTKAEAMRYAITKKQTVTMPAFVARLVGETAAKKANTWATRQLTIAQYNLAAANTLLGKTFWKLTVAIMSNPYAAAAAAVVALGGAVYALIKNNREAEVTADSLAQSISRVQNQARDTKDILAMVDIYEKLSNAAERDEKEQRKLVNVTKELAKTYPQAIAGINEETGALEINIEKVRELTEAEAKLESDRLEAESRRAGKKIKKLEKERDRLLELYEKEQGVEPAGGFYYAGLSDDKVIEWGKRLSEINEELGELYEAVKKVEELNFIGPLPKDESKTTDTLVRWKKTISEIQDEKVAAGAATIFSSDDIQNFESVLKFSKKLKEKRDELTASLRANQEAMRAATDETRESIQADITQDEETLKMIEAIRAALGILFKEAGHGHDTRLSDLRKEISDITNAYKKFLEIRQYKGEKAALIDINSMFPSLEGWEPTFNNMIAKLKEKLQNVREQLKHRPKDKALIDMERELQNAISNAQFDEFKKNIDKQLKRVSDELKRSEAARDFYNNILGLTGDETLAASLSLSVYGDTGKDLKERIQQQLDHALSTVSPENLSDELKKAVENQDFSYLLANIDKFEEKWHDIIKNSAADAQKYNAKVAQSYASLLMKYDEINQQELDIKNQYAQKEAEIEEGLRLEKKGILENEKIDNKEAAIQMAEDRANAAKEAALRERDVELFKISKDYRLFFSSVGVLSKQAARVIADNYHKMLVEQFEKGEISLTRFSREWDTVAKKLKEYEDDKNPIVTYLTKGLDGLLEKLSQAQGSMTAIVGTMDKTKGKDAVGSEAKSYLDDVAKLFSGKIFGVSGRKNVFEQLVDKFDGDMEKVGDAIMQAGDKLSELKQDMSAGIGWAGFWVSFAGGSIKAFDQIAQRSKNAEGDVKKGWNSVAKFIMASAAGMLTGTPITAGLLGQEWELEDAWERMTSLNEKAMSGFEKFKSGDIFGAIIDNIEGWSEVFGKNTKKYDREIKKQSKDIEDLDYQYKRLENSIQKAFGSDYIQNYTKELEVLTAKQEAYLAQAEAERSKAKNEKDYEHKYKETTEGYLKQAREVGDQIMDMQSKLSEFFAGTDLTSAAKDFANAWIEAYKEYGSVTTAMKEKFSDMVQSMIENSLAAKIMQELLQPIFDEIDKRALDGELSAADIATISEMATQQIPQINDAMVTLMNSLAAAGYNVRSKAGQFTGIARNIANASEESITGLAAGINTQNFYMSYMPLIYNQVAEILALMGGGTQQTAAAGATLSANNELMMMYLSSLPDINTNIAELLRAFKSVIAPNGASTNTYYVAVRA